MIGQKRVFVFLLLGLLMAVLLGCASLLGEDNQAARAEGDQVASAVAGTLTANSQQTATAANAMAATAAAEGTRASVPTESAAAQTSTVDVAAATAAATASFAPTLTPPTTDRPEGTALPSATFSPEQAQVLTQNLLVAYVGSSRDLWVWENGAARQLTKTGDVMEVSISDDGDWIAFSRSTDLTYFSLWMIRPSGSEEVQLMEQAEFDVIPHDPTALSVVPVGIAWQPGTHVLAFSTRPTFEGPGLTLNNDLWLINVDNRQRRELLPAGEGGRFYYSPDGSQIALVQPTSISLIDSNGENRRDKVLTYPEVSMYSEYRFYAAPQWSSDGRFLRVVIPPPASLEHPEEATVIWEIPVEGGEAERIGSVQTMPLSFPMLSPDLSKLAYLRQAGSTSTNRIDLQIANLDGSEDLTYLSDGFMQFTNWAPDSRRFVFTIGENSQSHLGEIGSPADRRSQPLSDVVTALEVRWLDINHFLFITRTETGFELRIGTVGQNSVTILGGPEATAHFPMYDFVIP